MKQVLIVEDDRTLSEGIGLTLEGPELGTIRAETLKQAEAVMETQSPDLILLDVNLPDGDGFTFCRKVRQQSDVPIIFLTANDLELDIVRGLELGGDDYITKPFSLMVLRARVHSVLRRRSNSGSPADREKVYRFGELCFDFDNLSFTRAGKPVSLSRTEQRLLRILVINRGNTLSKEHLIDRVWGTEYVDDHALAVTIKRLRDKLGTEHIKNIYGIGYTWVREEEMG